MDAAHVKSLATDLQTTLGLLGELITELQDHKAEWARSGRVTELVTRLAAQPHLVELPVVLLRANAEISEVLGGIRLTRAAIEAHASERIRDTQSKLSDVTSTTENATLELMNGLDRSLELINSLEVQSNGKASADGFQDLRNQLSTLYNHLQFQDITAQQLQGVTHSLVDLEFRVSAIAALFDTPHGIGQAQEVAAASSGSSHLAFNPDATMNRTRADQALIDQTFEGVRSGHPAERDCTAGHPGV